MNKNFLDSMENDILYADISEIEKNKLMRNFLKIKEQNVNIMITGSTGSGKSSTINAIFNMEVAKVGVSVDPETVDIEKYDLENLTLWDTPGLGDGKYLDNLHAKNIIQKLHERDKNGNLVIDLVLVILDGSTRDLGTSYELINSVIIPNLGENKKDRILVAINQADFAMKGRYWDEENNKPEPKLENFLDKKVESIQKRIRESTGVNLEPIYYSAGFKEAGNRQLKPYNLSKLLHFIIRHTPKEKRLSYIENINTEHSMWKNNDDLTDYSKNILNSFSETIVDTLLVGVNLGKSIGVVFGKTGQVVGSVLGGLLGSAIGVGSTIVKSFFKLF